MATTAEVRSWTTPGTQAAAQATYQSIRTALERGGILRSYDVDVFLQGSYENHTNTRGDSDVDIVVMMRDSYMPDLSRLSTQEYDRHESSSVSATVFVDDLRRDVERALREYYGPGRVHARNKCLKVDKRDGYVDADVVPCQQYRLFTNFDQYGRGDYIEGISIKPLSGQRITNYPKEHIKNGASKNERCEKLYKPTVRQIKRLRRQLVDAGLIGKKDAPGYLLECMTFNVPDEMFVPDDLSRLRTILYWMNQFDAPRLAASFMSCDLVHHLFKDDPGKHSEETAKRVIEALWNGVP